MCWRPSRPGKGRMRMAAARSPGQTLGGPQRLTHRSLPPVVIPIVVLSMVPPLAIRVAPVLAIPVMIVIVVAARRVPVSFVVTAASPIRLDPRGIREWRLRPVPVVPLVVAALSLRIPVALDPLIGRAGRRPHAIRPRRRWRHADGDAERNLRLRRRRGNEQQTQDGWKCEQVSHNLLIADGHRTSRRDQGVARFRASYAVTAAYRLRFVARS